MMSAFSKMLAVVVILVSWAVSSLGGSCGTVCTCEGQQDESVSCQADLDNVPNDLSPHITRLEMRNTLVERLDDSFQFYEALIDLDLGSNRINLILEKSFVSQVIKQSQTELILPG